MKKTSLSIKKMAMVGVLGGLSILLGLTPLGFIPIGPTRATIMHIPVIIGAIMEGPLVGASIGLIFGILSMFQAMSNPTPVSFVFLNPLVSILPRVLIGIVSFYAYKLIKDLGGNKSLKILNLLWLGIIVYLVYGIYVNIIEFNSIWPILMNILLIVLSLLVAFMPTRSLKTMP